MKLLMKNYRHWSIRRQMLIIDHISIHKKNYIKELLTETSITIFENSYMRVKFECRKSKCY